MFDFANLSDADRQLAFEQTAAQMGLPTHLIEKDFWVCFTLKVLFSLEDHADNLTFKGGTSLSKVYKAIERFSEDIDFAINRDCLGYSGDNAPDVVGISGKERKRRVEELALACQRMVESKLLPDFEQKIASKLTSSNWQIDFKAEEKRNQVIYFQYPKSILTTENSYNPSSVRVEMTARTDNHPSVRAFVIPYVAEIVPQMIENPHVGVEVLAIERTFWEKATILHQFHFQSDVDRVAKGFSRHYYDIYRLDFLEHTDAAIAQIELLPEVADHKTIFYRQGSARYELAREPHTLQLLPHKNIVETIKRDYEDMREMMYGPAPGFEEILDRIAALQKKINGLPG